MKFEETKRLSTGIYIRVSTEEQAREGFSINAQKEKLTQYAMARDWDIYNFYIDDGISGKNIKDRPEINKMLNDLADGKINNVLVYKIDRLTRSTKNLIELVELFNECECSFNSLMESIDTSSATGRMFIKIVGIFAEFERENLAERVSFGYEQKTREGNYTNTHGVYGYDYIIGEGKLVVNEEERKIVEYIYQQYLSGTSMCKIAVSLIAKQVPTKRGGKWCQSTLCSILTNPLYIGKVRYKVKGNNSAFEADSEYEPILSVETFYEAQEIMKKRKKYQTRRYPSENSLFLGVLFCSACGMKLGTSQHKKANGKLYINYFCYNRKNGNCTSSIFSQTRIEQAFLEYISKIDEFTPEEDILIKTEKSKNMKELEKIKKDVQKTENRISEIRNLFVQEKINFEEYRIFMKDLDQKLLLLRSEFEKMTPAEEEKIDYEKIKDIIGNLNMNWRYLTPTEKGEFVHRFIERIEVHSDNGNLTISKVEFAKTPTKQKVLNT